VTASNRADPNTLNQYEAELITYTAQATALNARRNALQTAVGRQTAASR
jgi:hypothetical protein